MSKNNWFAERFAEYEKDPEFQAGVLRLSFYEDMLRIMEEKGINRTELAARLGCSKAYITKLFSDSTNVTIHTMGKIAMALGCELKITMEREEVTSEKYQKRTLKQIYGTEYEEAKTDCDNTYPFAA